MKSIRRTRRRGVTVGIRILHVDVQENEKYDDNSSSGKALAAHPRSASGGEYMIKCAMGYASLERTMHDKAGLFDSSYRFADTIGNVASRAIKSGSKFKKDESLLGLYITIQKDSQPFEFTKKQTASSGRRKYF